MKYCFPLAAIFVSAGLICAQQTAAPPKPLAIPSPSALPAPAPAVISSDTVVLTIGDEKITKAQFEEIIATLPEQQRAQLQAPGGKRKFAESLAELKTLAQEGRARKLDQIAIVQAQIKLQVDQIIARNMFQELAKEQSNATPALAAPPTAAPLPPTEGALQAYYDTHKQDWEEVKAKHILIRFKGSGVPVRAGQKDLSDAEALAKANEIRAKIIAGAKFDDLAKAESDDTGNAPQGGDLGSFPKGRMVPQFDQAAFAAEVGKVTEPVKTQFGYHLILVESHARRTFEQAHAEIEQKMKQQQAAEAQQRAQQQAAEAQQRLQELGQKALADLKVKKNIVYDESYFGTSGGSIRSEIDSIASSGNYSALPVPVRTTGDSPAGGGVRRVVKNDTVYELRVLFSGPVDREIVIAPGATQSDILPAGEYRVAAKVSAANVRPFYGVQSYDSGSYSDRFFIRTGF